MKRFLIRLIISFMFMVAGYSAHAQQLSSGAINSIQQQFGGRVVGVNGSGGDSVQVQVLQPNGSVVIVIVNSNTGAIQGVSR